MRLHCGTNLGFDGGYYMTCSKDFGRLLQAAALGLIGTLAFAGCGGSESKKDGGGGSGGIDGGTGGSTGAALNVTPNTLNLGTIDRTAGGVGSVTLTNTGKSASGTISIVGTDGITATGCAGTLAAGASCPITIIVKPPATATTLFTGTVSISANPGAYPTALAVSVTATLLQTNAPYTVSPSSIDIGNIAVGTQAPKQNITVTAISALTDMVITSSGAEVSIDKTATTCTAALPAGQSCTIVVNFMASTAGQKKDSIQITAAGAPWTVAITANAQAPAKLAINPLSAQITAAVGQTSSPVTFGVINLGDLATGPIVVDIAGANKTSFSQTNNCLALANLGTCTITVLYKPTAATPATETASLTVTDSLGLSTVAAALTGTPVGPSNLTITSTGTDLGTVLVGSTGTATVFTVSNGGDTASGAISVGLSSTEFVVTNDTCTGASLPAKNAATCTVSVAFKPNTVGAKVAVLSVVGAANPTAPAVKNVTGTGITACSLSATPASLDFQNVRVNKTGTEQTVTVKNNGGTACGSIVINKAGDFDVFPITANTCSAALAAGVGTCSFTVNFAPKAAKGYAATYSVSDGQSSATVTVSGAGLQSTGLTIAPSPVGACAEPDLNPTNVDKAISTTSCFPATVVGGTGAPITVITLADGGTVPDFGGSTISFVVTADSMPAGTSDTGVLTVALNPATPADFKIVTDGCSTKTLLLNASCQVSVAFSPTAVGLRQASLTVTSANGGSDSATLQGLGLALLEIRPLDLLDEDDKPITGLDFGQLPVLGDKTMSHDYLLIVRGPNTATASTSQVLATLTDPSQPADFMYQNKSLVNPCNTASNQAVTLNFATGDMTGVQGRSWEWQSAYKVFTCPFSVTFYPQSTKGAKTATLSATGSGSASDSKTLTGTATGSLTFSPDKPSFDNPIQVGSSTNTQTIVSTVSLSGNDVTVTLENHSTTTDYGPISLTLGGANPDQFIIVEDTCTTVTLLHSTASANDNDICFVSLAFVPTSAGAKSALLTANGGGETASVTITAGAVDPFDITISPDQFVAANNNVHDFGTVAQTSDKTWAAFTITNPAGSPSSAQVAFGIGLSPEGSDSSYAFTLANGNNHDMGTCGNAGTTTLAAGASCYFWVQFKPGVEDSVDLINPMIGWIYATDKAKDKTVFVKGSGKVASVVSIAPATYTFPDTPAGATSAAATLTVTNNGASTITLGIPANDAALAPFNVDQNTGCAVGGKTLGAGATCALAVTFVGRAGITASVIDKDVPLTVTAISYSGAEATTKLTGTSVLPAKLVAVGYVNPDGAWSQTINMGGVRVGASSADVSLLFKNIGSVATSSLSYGWTNGDTPGTPNTQDAEFIINTEDPTRCAGKTSLGAGETCTVAIRFTPSAAAALGPRSANAKKFTLSAVTGGLVQVFKFTATSLDPSSSGWIGISGGANAFHTFPGASVGLDTGKPTTGFPKQVFQVTNGTAAAVTLTLSDPGPNFTLISQGTADVAGSAPCYDLPARVLSASNSCTFAVGFRPNAYTATTVYRHATVAASGGAGIAGAELGLYGKVQAPASLTITPAVTGGVNPFDFGEVVVNTSPNKSFTVTNTGETKSAAVAMTLIGDTSPGGRFALGGACTAALDPGASCVGNLTFSAPTAPVATAPTYSVNLRADAGAVSSAAVTALARPMKDTTLTVSPSTISFPVTSVGTTSAAVTIVTLHNDQDSMTSGLLTISVGDSTNFSLSIGDDCPLYTDPTATKGLVMSPLPNVGCHVSVFFKPQTLGTGTFETDLTMRATPGSLKSIHITGVAQSAMHTSPATSTVMGTACTIDSPCQVTAYLDRTAPLTSYVKTSITGGNYMIVEDQCVATKMLGGDSCRIYVAYLGTTAEPLKTGTLTVNGGNAGNTATLVLNSITPPAVQ
jgi:hypothetical protein